MKRKRTKTQTAAQQRNFLIYRLKGMITQLENAIQVILPVAVDADIIDAKQKLESAVERLTQKHEAS